MTVCNVSDVNPDEGTGIWNLVLALSRDEVTDALIGCVESGE